MTEVTTTLEFQMSLLLFVSLAGYMLASRIGQPAVVGVILVGVVIGPSVLGWITVTDFISSLAHLGAIILLFVIGLEFKLHDLANPKYAIIGLLGVVVPLLMGYLTAVWFEFATTQALIIGVALTATSIAITADTLREMGQLQTEAATAIIGAAVVDDVLALVALTIANQYSQGDLALGGTIFVFGKAIAFLGVGAIVGYYVLSPLVQKFDCSQLTHKYPELVFIFAMMIAFFYALLAEMLHLSAIVGSFMAGVSLERVKVNCSLDFKKGAEYLRIIFASIFFVSLGVLADLKALTGEILVFLLVVTIVAFISKIIGCGVPAKLLGMSWRDSTVVGLGMAPRGEVAMIVALLALDQKIIDQPVYVTIVLMSLITTVLPPLVIKNWLTPSE